MYDDFARIPRTPPPVPIPTALPTAAAAAAAAAAAPGLVPRPFGGPYADAGAGVPAAPGADGLAAAFKLAEPSTVASAVFLERYLVGGVAAVAGCWASIGASAVLLERHLVGGVAALVRRARLWTTALLLTSTAPSAALLELYLVGDIAAVVHGVPLLTSTVVCSVHLQHHLVGLPCGSHSCCCCCCCVLWLLDMADTRAVDVLGPLPCIAQTIAKARFRKTALVRG